MARNKWLRSASIGPHFVVCLVLGYWMGFNLDKWFESEPVFTIIFVLFGVAAGFINLIKEVQILNEEGKRERERDE